MTKKRIKELIDEAIPHQNLVNLYMVHNENYYNLIPVKASDRLFLAINEDDFIFDGFRVSRFRDVEKARIKKDKCDEIIRAEGLFDHLHIPEIDLTSWATVFISLQGLGKNIIVENETGDEENDEFGIGRIESVHKNHLYLRHFDADGVWRDKPWRIPYTAVTSVTFDSRYVNIFSKYISPA